jgi:hypothetical protein
MTDAEFWEVERELWLGGAEAFRRWVAADCVIVLPEPAGILTGAAIFENVGAPRWHRLEIARAVLRRGTTEAAVLGYLAEATRTDGSPYRALCSSSYVQVAGGWWLVQHQQTPVGRNA